MKNKVIICIIILIMTCFLLCGCDESTTKKKSDITSLNVGNPEIRTVRFYGQNQREILEPYSSDFIYNPNMEAYEIHGYVTNEDDSTIEYVEVIARYYDQNHDYLTKQSVYWNDFHSGMTKEFLFAFTNSIHFENVKEVDFGFSFGEPEP